MRKCSGDESRALCSETQPVKVMAGFNLDECKDACRDDPDCQGGYHARQKISSKRGKRYDAACYLLGVAGADQKSCDVAKTKLAAKFLQTPQPTTENRE